MPDFTQNFNRYSYALNNPLRYRDESGEVIGTIVTFIYDFFRTFFVGGLNGNDKIRKNAWKNFDPSASWSKTNKAWEIAKGAWRTDSNKPLSEQIYSVIRRWTFEGIQSSIGKTFSHCSNMFDKVNVRYYKEATVVSRKDSNNDQMWGVTIGSYINTMNEEDNDLVRHEYGHVLQSQILGLMYLPIIGIPSMIGCAFDEEVHDHHREWYETWSNILSYEYLTNYSPSDLQSDAWNDSDYSRKYNLDWYFSLNVLFSL